MSFQAQLTRCSSCKRIIPPYERAVKFPCPNCGSSIIVRCSKCRVLTVQYTCIKCGFKGP